VTVYFTIVDIISGIGTVVTVFFTVFGVLVCLVVCDGFLHNVVTVFFTKGTGDDGMIFPFVGG